MKAWLTFWVILNIAAGYTGLYIYKTEGMVLCLSTSITNLCLAIILCVILIKRIIES